MTEDIDIEKLAERACFSPRHFNRLFKSVYSITPKQYIMDLRFSIACRLLRETGLPVTEISSRCGYPDSSYFARIFCRKLSMTPTEYRKSSKI
jgi:AraC family L-rhamnose operon transcriptional activator RhaR/AraC family L-rhamnose operon regulatory protein RhaS